MKTKLCKFSLIIMCLYSLFFWGCEQNISIDQETFCNNTYQDSIFLKIEGNLYDPTVIWGNVDTYLAAFHRMTRHLKLKDNCLEWDFKTASDIGVSENIYIYVTDTWKQENLLLATQKYELVCVGDGHIVKSKETVQTKGGFLLEERFVLKQGNHNENMKILLSIVRSYGFFSGHGLAEAIGISKSDFKGNGMGDVSIGGYASADSNYCSYSCCNACAFDKSDIIYCSHNLMTSQYQIIYADVTILWIRNPQQLPLITVQNPHLFTGRNNLYQF